MKEYFLAFLTGYLFGSIPFAYIISRLRRIDIRKIGDKNPGARNVYKNVGKMEGILVGFFDALKGFVPFVFFHYLLNEKEFSLISGLGSITGHAFPVFLKFYGGKSISTIIGIYFGLFPMYTFITFIFFWIIFKIKKHFDLSIAVSFVFFLFILFLKGVEPKLIIYTVFIMLFIGFKKLLDLKRERFSEK